LTDQILTGVGAELKRAREAAGLPISDVARQLKLLPRQIESLEHERFERLPGPAIARGMVRNYARLLKLDPEPLLESLAPRAEQPPKSGRPAAARPAPLPDASRRSTMLYVGFSVALLVGIAALAYVWQREKSAPQIVAPLPPKPLQSPIAKPPEPPAVEAEVKAEPPPPAPKPEPEAAAQPTLPAGTHRLVLRMEGEAWIEVRDGAGRSLVSSLNPAGSERTVRGQPPFQVVVGNAAGVTLTYDGKPVDLKPHIRGDVARLTLK
jgi:cytoskeleton protein RodZ